jgi:hypothetical protein
MRPLALTGILLTTLLLAGCESVAVPAETPARPQSQVQPGAAPLNEWAPRIAIVAAQGRDLAQSYGVNVSVWPGNKVLCGKPPSPPVSLYVSKNNEPGELVSAPPTMTQRTAGNVAFPSAEFDDVPASLAADPGARFNFVAYERGQPASNVWLHTGDKPGPGSGPVKPTGYSSPNPAAVDTRIQVVFPHDEQGRPADVKAATRINVALDIFQHGTTLSVTPDAAYQPQLWIAQGGDRLSPLPPRVQKTTYTVGAQGYPRWEFDDVHVQPGQTYHLLATTGPLGQPGGSYPTIWTYTTGTHPASKPEPTPACIP